MAKKKTPKDSEAQIRTRQLKELQVKHKELEGKLEAAKELLSDKDTEIDDKVVEINRLLQQIKDDTGIPPSTSGELISARKVAKKLEDVNGALKNENADLKAKIADMMDAAPVLSEAPAKTSVPLSLITACLTGVNLSMNTKKFVATIPALVDNAIILAEAIQSRHDPGNPAGRHGSNPLSDSCEDEE